MFGVWMWLPPGSLDHDNYLMMYGWNVKVTRWNR
ncbi:hypothetical protein [Escherichia phage vB_EcoP_LHP]